MIRIRHDHYIHFVPETPQNDSETIQLLKQIINQNTDMAKKLSDVEAEIDTLTTKVTDLQTTVDEEQVQIKAAIDALNASSEAQTALIQQLRDELAALGADQETIDRIVTKAEQVNTQLDTIKTDLEGTISDAPAPEA